MVRAERLPLGNTVTIFVNEGDVNAEGEVATESDRGYCYGWWRRLGCTLPNFSPWRELNHWGQTPQFNCGRMLPSRSESFGGCAPQRLPTGRCCWSSGQEERGRLWLWISLVEENDGIVELSETETEETSTALPEVVRPYVRSLEETAKGMNGMEERLQRTGKVLRGKTAYARSEFRNMAGT